MMITSKMVAKTRKDVATLLRFLEHPMMFCSDFFTLVNQFPSKVSLLSYIICHWMETAFGERLVLDEVLKPTTTKKTMVRLK